MADGWSGRFADFEGVKSSAKKPKTERMNNSFRMNRSRYTPLKVETPSKKMPLVELPPSNMGPPKPQESAKKSVFHFKAEKVNPIPVDLEEDWGDDDFEVDLNSLQAQEEESHKEPKITDEELQEMTMALMNDDSVFDFDEPPAPMDPSKARLNQTTAVFGARDMFEDEDPRPDLIIQELREENKKLASELKLLEKRKVENQELQRRLDQQRRELEKEQNIKRNLETDMKKEMERIARNTKEKEAELTRLREELEAARFKASEAANERVSLARTQIKPEETKSSLVIKQEQTPQSQPTKKRKLMDTPSEAVKPSPPLPTEEFGLVEQKIQDSSLVELPLLPDFLLEQFCSLTTTDLVSQRNILIKTRRGVDCRVDWGYMLEKSAEKISTISNSLRLELEALNRTEADSTVLADLAVLNSTAGGNKTSPLDEQCDLTADTSKSSRKLHFSTSEIFEMDRELNNIVHMILFSGVAFMSREMEIVFETCLHLYRLMLESGEYPLLGRVTQVLTILWDYEVPEKVHLIQLLKINKEILTTLQESAHQQASSSCRANLIDLIFIILQDEDCLSLICNNSDSCFLQSIFLELEAGCYKLKLVGDILELYDPSLDMEDDLLRTKDEEKEAIDEDLSNNHKLIVEGVQLVSRFVNICIQNTRPMPWINKGCIDCNSVLLRAVVALLYSTLTIFLDRTSDLGKDGRNKDQETMLSLMEECVQVLYKMKMEVVQYKKDVTEPWIKVVEKIKSGNKKRFVWSLGALKKLIREPHLSTLQSLLLERS